MSAVVIDSGDTRAHGKYERLIAAAKQVPAAVTLVVHPCDESSLKGVCEAAAAGIVKPVLVGPAGKIKAVASQFNLDISRFEIVDAPHSEAAAARAVELIHEAKGELLMKGSLHTDELMRGVTAKATGLRTDRRSTPRRCRATPTVPPTPTPNANAPDRPKRRSR
jgi:phosphate acetyltransferase